MRVTETDRARERERESERLREAGMSSVVGSGSTAAATRRWPCLRCV